MTRSAPHLAIRLAPACALLACAASARAADLPVAPPPVFASPWAGLYAGSILGAENGSFRSSQTASRSVSSWGESVGALIGYSFQSGPFVFGPEADLTLDVVHVHNPGVAPGLVSSSIRTLYTSRVRARFGYDLGQFLPFVAAGVAFNRNYQYNDPTGQFGQTREQTGYTLGAGLEYRFVAPVLGPLVLRGEYIYDAYPTETYGLLGGPVRTRMSAQTVRVALISHIGETWRAPADEAVTPDWSGAYAGLLGGGLWTQTRTTLGGASTTNSASGPTFGAYSGYNFQFGSWVLGIDGSTEVASVTGTGPQPTIASVNYRNFFEFDLRGRAGYAIGRFLPYVALGGDWGLSEQTDPATGSFRGRVPSQSVTAGAGVEYMLSERWSTRLEYVFDTGYKNQSSGLDGLSLEQSRRAQGVRLGLAYYFH